MSTVRIQVRRGTASQWTSVNPILAAGEMGVESDTNLFKFGNGSSTWTALAYANNSDVAIGEISQDAINTALTMGAGLSKTYNDGANTITINVDSNVVALKSYVDSAVSGLANTVDSDYIPMSDRGIAGGVASLDNSGKVPSGQLNIDNTVISLIDSKLVPGRGIRSTWDNATSTKTLYASIDVDNGLVKTDSSSNNGITISLPNTIQAQTKFSGPLIQVGTVEAEEITTGNITISGNLSVNGTTTTVNTESFSVSDPLVYFGENNQSNSLDLGFVTSFNNGTYQHSGLVRDASEGKWRLFSGVIDEPTATVNFTGASKDALEVGGLFADAARIGDTTNAEIQRLHGVTSSVQDQLDAKVNTAYANSTYAPILSPTFNGTVTLPEGTVTSGMIANGTIVNADISNSADISISKIANLTSTLASKAPSAAPTFTGSVVLPETTAIGSVTKDEIGRLSGVTSSIQTQINTVSNGLAAAKTSYDATIGTIENSVYTLQSDLNSAENTISSLESSVTSINTTTSSLQTQINTKASTASLAAHEADTTNIHGIADTTALATKTYADSAVSTAVAGLTKSSVGLANVDNTSDANKPISSATQTALNLKASLSSPTFTGTVSGITKSMVGLANVDNTSDANKPVSTATQTALDAKLALAGGTMTGALTLSGAPTSDLHAATKLYVDSVASGINFHAPVKAATSTNISTTYANGTNGYGATLTADANGAMGTVDGQTMSVGDRVLVKSQTDAKQNGIYVVTSLGGASSKWVMTRATDDDNNPNGEMSGGDFCFVTAGTLSANTGYILSGSGTLTIGTDNINYVQFNAAQAILAGSGLTKTGGTLSIATGAITSDMILDGTIVDADINASAAIAQSKISGLSTSLGLKANLATPSFTGGVTVDASGIIFTDGSQTKQGVPSLTTIISKTADYTLSNLSERDSLIEINASGSTTLTVPADSSTNYPVGTSLDILRVGAGAVTVSPAAGVTLNYTPGNKLRAQWSSATLVKRAANTWVLLGDLTA